MFRVTAYEHVGIRVSDRAAAVAFYELLGWHEVEDLPEHQANEMINEAGVRINLIFNGVRRVGLRNVLQDELLKFPGVTHAAFVVDDLEDLLATLEDAGIPLSGGPDLYANRRRVVFLRDPDGNVLEFNELLAV